MGKPNFCNIISEARKKMGMTQYDLARAANISPAHICKIENGARYNLRFSTFERIAAALGLSISDLFKCRTNDSIAQNGGAQ